MEFARGREIEHAGAALTEASDSARVWSGGIWQVVPPGRMMGKHIVITGTSRGLGRALVAGFVARGHTLSGCSRSLESMAHLQREYAAPHFFREVDVSCPDNVAAWAESAVRKNGIPDLVICNAAVINPNDNLWEVADDAMSALIDINVKGTFYVCKSFLRYMLPRGCGVLVNFSSGWGRSCAAEVATYCSSKWAVEGLTRSLAEELPPGMAAVPVNPGVIHTQMLESCLQSSAASFPEPAQWAQTAVPFLLGLSGKDNGRPLTIP